MVGAAAAAGTFAMLSVTLVAAVPLLVTPPTGIDDARSWWVEWMLPDWLLPSLLVTIPVSLVTGWLVFSRQRSAGDHAADPPDPGEVARSRSR
jgi:hypothetical protein